MRRPQDNLIAKILSGNASPDEREELSKLDSEELSALRKVWDLTAGVREPQTPRNQWQKFCEKRLRAGVSDSESKQSPGRSKVLHYGLRLAAGLVIVLLAYWVLQNVVFDDIEIRTANAERRVHELPDGSQVELNAATQVVYSKDFGRASRRVFLDGEAFFEIAPAATAFWVETDEARATVLGTAFNLRTHGDKTELAVEHGRVRFQSGTRDADVTVGAGQVSRVIPGEPPTRPRNVNLEIYLGWRAGRLEFRQTPVAEVLAELHRQFDVGFDLPESAEEQTLTASFHTGQEIEEILAAICLTFDWKFEKKNGKYQIRG